MERPSSAITLTRFSYLFAAVCVGIVSVFYARFISCLQGWYFSFYHSHPYWISGATPFLFIIGTGWVVKFAPEAKGSGIPQVLSAIEISKRSDSLEYQGLVSIKTAIVKVISSGVGILGGASLGREGPTVQISVSLFSLIGSTVQNRLKRFVPQMDTESYLIAGGAAGIAAAFNTPLAGITFALEEVAHGASFSKFKEWVILSVVIAGVTAQALAGNFLYFGHPLLLTPDLPVPLWVILVPEALVIGFISGVSGGVFARLISHPAFSHLLPSVWWIRSGICGVLCAALIFVSHGTAAGSGYEVTRQLMDAENGSLDLLYPVLKFFVTVFSYLSGMAGGIFSPALSIGSGIGFSTGSLLHFVSLKSCALFGMVGFFSGVVHAPLTAVIIVMEMTDEHLLILPFLAAAYLAQIVSKRVMPTPLYSYIAFGKQNEG